MRNTFVVMALTSLLLLGSSMNVQSDPIDCLISTNPGEPIPPEVAEVIEAVEDARDEALAVATCLVEELTDDEPECEDVLTLIFGVDGWDGCAPSGGDTCLDIGGIPVVCAEASYGVQFAGQTPISNLCPDGIGDPPPPSGRMNNCWLEDALGWGFGLLPDHMTVTTYIVDVCTFGAAQSCVADPDPFYKTTESSILVYCGNAVASTWATGLAWAHGDDDCAEA